MLFMQLLVLTIALCAVKVMSFPDSFSLRDSGYTLPNQYVYGHDNGDISSTTTTSGDALPKEGNWRFVASTDASNTYKLYNIYHSSWVFRSHGSFGIYSAQSEAAPFVVTVDPLDANKVTIKVAGNGPYFDGFAYSQSYGVYYIGTAF